MFRAHVKTSRKSFRISDYEIRALETGLWPSNLSSRARREPRTAIGASRFVATCDVSLGLLDVTV